MEYLIVAPYTIEREESPVSASPVKRRVGVVLTAALLAIGAPFIAHIGTADAAQVAAAGFVTSASVDRAQATVGQSVAVTASVRSNTSRRALIDVEIYDRSGRKVFQKYWDNQSFTSGQTRRLSTAWATSGLTAGPYTVKIGVFGVGWTSLIHWNDNAAAVTLMTSAPTTTTRPPSTTTTAPTTTTAATTTTTTTTTTTSTTTTTTAPTTTTTAPPTSGRFATLPVGAALPTGAQCAARVRPAVEIRPENATANNNRGSRANANTRNDWSGFNRVDGDFAGTTDQIIQWVACKWGIDEDIVRAQIIKESYWYHSGIGDNGESFGLGQVRTTAHPSAFQYSINARTSSAYNLDYTYASWRACFEGVYTWLNTVERNGTYAAGDAWGCVGMWFSGRWYVNTDAYLNQTGDSVRWHYNNKTWLTSSFING
jgi:autotransporter family porin